MAGECQNALAVCPGQQLPGIPADQIVINQNKIDTYGGGTFLRSLLVRDFNARFQRFNCVNYLNMLPVACEIRSIDISIQRPVCCNIFE
ncbi:MAG: hypothetical protein EA369_00120 [Bradymonadales bacterium]|nr:MAG: hypothetical protein EA369_00120 [Bradymonadales bacterium]